MADLRQPRLRTVVALGVIAPLLVAAAALGWWGWTAGTGMAAVGGPTAVALLAAVWISARLASSLERALAGVERQALDLAGGGPGARPEPPRFREVRRIADSLTGASDAFERRMREISAANLGLERRARDAELLAHLSVERPARPGAELHAEWLHGRSVCADPSGYVVTAAGTSLLGWIVAEPHTDLLDALRLRREIESTCRRLIEALAGSRADLLASLRPLYAPEVTAFVYLDAGSRRIELLVRRPLAILLDPVGANPRVTEIATDFGADLAPAGLAALSSADPRLCIAASTALRSQLREPIDTRAGDSSAEGLLIGLHPVPAAIRIPHPTGIR